MFTNFQNKAVGFGMGTLVSIAQKKKCFQRGSLTQGTIDHMEWNANTRGEHLLGISTFHLEIKLPPHSRYGTGKKRLRTYS